MKFFWFASDIVCLLLEPGALIVFEEGSSVDKSVRMFVVFTIGGSLLSLLWFVVWSVDGCLFDYSS